MSSIALHSSTPSPRPRYSLDLPDAEAVRGIIAGNREMFEIIVRRYNTQLYRVGMAYLRDHAQTEDAMQEAYLKAFLKLDRFQGNAAFSTWLTRIMINECLMILRRKKRFTTETIEDMEMHPDYPNSATTSPDTLAQQETKAVLERAIQALPRSHRAVYLMREVQQLSTAETARCLGMSLANVKVSLHRAREGLKAQLLKSAAGIELFSYEATYCDPMTTRVMIAIRSA